MSRRLWFLIPGDPDTPTGGYVYDRRIAAGLADAGWLIEHRRLDASFPNPSRAALDHARQTLAEIPDEELVLIDGLALGAMPAPIRDESRRLRIVALVHHPLADETGLEPARRAELQDSETLALTAVHGTIVTSRFTADRMIRDGVPIQRLHVIEPGVDPSPRAEGVEGDPVSLICVATLTERKGHDILLDALAGLRDLPWRLTCIGDLYRDPAWSARILEHCERLDLTDRVRFIGAVAPQLLEQHYRSADLAVLATRFEGYGMVVTEAVAHGLPMVLTAGGAAAETLPDGAGILVPVDDVEALRQALRRLLSDPDERARLAENAWRAARDLLSWDQAARTFSAALEDLGMLPKPPDPVPAISATDPDERFPADWLALREPLDHASRSPAILEAMRRWAAGKDPLRVVDLGCGSGSNLRYLCSRLPVSQHWVCVDRDPELIARLTTTAPSSANLVGLKTRVAPIQTPGLLDDIDDQTLVTASALLDLVSEDWLADLVAVCRRRGAALLVAMTYDGRVEIHPEHPSDAWILDRFDRDQRRDKGLGPALGPTAARRLCALAEAQGFRIHQASSDWLLDGGDRELMTQLIAGWAEAVARQSPAETDRIEGWHRQRRQDLVSRTLSIRVGHQDLFLALSFPSRP